jgi:muramoyltetrapeptide carboxypeptidase
MTQLDLSVGFAKAAGVMVGVCEDCGPEHEEISLTLDQTSTSTCSPCRFRR